MTHARRTLDIESYESLLMEYVAGTLDGAQAFIIGTHLRLSPRGRDLVHEFESLAATLLEKCCEPVPMSPHSLEATLQRLEQSESRAQPQQPRSRAFPADAHVPDCVEQVFIEMGFVPAQTKWRTIYPGLRAMRLPVQCRTSKTHIFQFNPGTGAPDHAHRGIELTLILDGAFADDEGVYEPGDLLVSTPQSPAHAPKACEKQGCVCLNVFSGGAVRLTGPLARLLNPFLRF
jgi:putative transcriptional regulator